MSAAEHSEIWVTHREWNPVDGTEGALSFPAAVNSVISVVLSWRKESDGPCPALQLAGDTGYTFTVSI